MFRAGCKIFFSSLGYTERLVRSFNVPEKGLCGVRFIFREYSRIYALGGEAAGARLLPEKTHPFCSENRFSASRMIES
jgi:hypothetical protein